MATGASVRRCGERTQAVWKDTFRWEGFAAFPAWFLQGWRASGELVVPEAAACGRARGELARAAAPRSWKPLAMQSRNVWLGG